MKEQHLNQVTSVNKYVHLCFKQFCSVGENFRLTFGPWKRDRALRGLRVLRVLKDRPAPSSVYPSMPAAIAIRDTWKTQHT